MPGANESSTVEWHSAQVMPTRVSVSLPPTFSTVPLRPTTALSFSSATVVAGLVRPIDAVLDARDDRGRAAPRRRPSGPTASAVVGSTAVWMTSCMRSVSVQSVSSPNVSKRKISLPCAASVGSTDRAFASSLPQPTPAIPRNRERERGQVS